jgi:C1A family cysteine protease
MSPTKRRFGWIPDVPDHRDHVYALSLALAPHKLPERIDLTGDCPPVYDQGSLGSCTANAVAAVVEFDLKRQKLRDLPPSRLFEYYNTRALEGTVDVDAGAMLRNAIKVVVRTGECQEKTWPYEIPKFAVRPDDRCYEEAARHRAVSYRRLSNDLGVMKGCLAEGFPFVFGVAVYDSFLTEAVETTGNVPLPLSGERGPGPDGGPAGHAMVAVGYDDTTGRFRIRNSWGTSWGDRGYGTIPYAYLTDSGLGDDYWTIRLVH